MTTIIAKWPAIRQAVYSALAAVLAVGAAVGWVTPDQSDQWLGLVAQVLGAAGLIVAVLHVDRSKPATEPAPVVNYSVNVPNVDADAAALRREQKLIADGIRRTDMVYRKPLEQVIANGAAAVDAARRELEQRLGR